MANLKKLFNADRPLFLTNGSPEPIDHDGSISCSPCNPANKRLPRLPNQENQAFLGIERQFEELHDQYQHRSPSPLPSKRYKHIEPKPSPLRTNRHVDVLEAIFSAHRYRISAPVSPTTLYNEDIAERNLSTSYQLRTGSHFSQVVSAIYQEDVADRNIQINGNTFQRNAQYDRGYVRRDSHVITRSKSHISSLRRQSSDEDVGLRAAVSDQNLRIHLCPLINELSNQHGCETHPQPEEYAQSWNSALSFPTHTEQNHQEIVGNAQELDNNQAEARHPAALKRIESKQQCPKPLPQLPNIRTPHHLSPNTARGPSKKNVHALSINTKLAAPKTLFVKVTGQSADFPISTPQTEDSVSIAEIVSSPAGISPTIASARSTNYNVKEIMNLFKQAYASSQSPNPHPTFETLQDAIVREINSHDAFRQLNSDGSFQNPPDLSPDLSPDGQPLHHENYITSQPPSRSTSGKDGKWQPRVAGRASFRKQRRSSDCSGRELSFPALKGIGPNGSIGNVPRRRHTYAQPPSHELMGKYKNRQSFTSRRPSSHRFSDGTFANKHENRSSTQYRPFTSQGFLSKAVSAILDTSDPSKRLQPRRSPRGYTFSSNKSGTRRSGSAKDDELYARNPSPPAIHVFQDDEDEGVPYLYNCEPPIDSLPQNSASTTTPQKRPTHIPIIIPDLSTLDIASSNPANQITSAKRAGKTMYHTSPMAANRKRIPARSSSMQKDLLDSSRFKP
ncbi:hypothetical protein FQN57_005056 [Myotisia sp. PD_48]|nr:hypothetical protein FQN57_005056 [Myotisia sp. PD_48]